MKKDEYIKKSELIDYLELMMELALDKCTNDKDSRQSDMYYGAYTALENCKLYINKR